MLARGKLALQRIVKCNRGATAIEYGLIVALIAMAAIAALGSVGTSLSGVFTEAEDGMSTP